MLASLVPLTTSPSSTFSVSGAPLLVFYIWLHAIIPRMRNMDVSENTVGLRATTARLKNQEV